MNVKLFLIVVSLPISGGIWGMMGYPSEMRRINKSKNNWRCLLKLFEIFLIIIGLFSLLESIISLLS